MKQIPLPEYEVVPLDNIAPDVRGLRILFVNVFAVGIRGGPWTLIDAGLYLSATRIRHWAENIFGEGAPPQAIILTHGHFDHVGALQDLADHWGVSVYAHPLEMPYITGLAEYPPPDPKVGGGMMALMSPLYPRGPIDITTRARPLPTDGSVPGMPGWKWVPTPGHSPGHISLFRELDHLLLVGDAFCTTKQESLFAVAEQRPELHGPPAYYTPDWDAARSSVQALAALQPACIAPSHGQPMAGDEVAAQVKQLADEFDSIALPEHGRYVNR